jgi:outer membrane protein assembly factor BamB
MVSPIQNRQPKIRNRNGGGFVVRRARYGLIAGWMVLCLCRRVFPSDEWPQFRGPNGSGVSASKDLPVEFDLKRNLLWKVDIPPGHSSPVLASESIFLTAFEGEKLLVLCLERQTGRLLWRREVPRNRTDRLRKPNNPASPSPVTDGENVYAFFQDFGLISYDRNGKERWQVPLGPFNSFWGMAASPVLVEDKLVISCDQDTNSFLLAVEKQSGRSCWRIERPGVISGYSTPVQFWPKAGPAQIVIPESFQLSAYSIVDGNRLWWVRGLACEMKSIPAFDGETLYINGWGFPENQPGKQVAIPALGEVLRDHDADKDGRISLKEVPDEPLKQEFFFSLFDLDRDKFLKAREWNLYRASMSAENGLLAIRIGGNGDMTQNNIRWRYQKPVPQVPSTLLYQDVLYMVNDGGILTAFDPSDGAVTKQGRLEGAIDKYFASPVAGDDKVYLVSQGGAVSVLKAGRDWQILAVNHLDDECYATPAIADGRVYIRSQSALYCFGKRD